jgi:hypothetical protein
MAALPLRKNGVCEMSLINVALNKPASQSSLSSRSVPGEAGRAVDGLIKDTPAFHTDHEETPWWQVDLSEPIIVEKIVIYNTRQFTHRASPIEVRCSVNGLEWETVYLSRTQFGGLHDGNPLVIELGGRVCARYVRIQINKPSWLHLSQVEIYADHSQTSEAEILINSGIDVSAFYARRTRRYADLTVVQRGWREQNARLNAIHLTKFGRFGNIVMQLIHAVAVARAYDIPDVFLDTTYYSDKLFSIAERHSARPRIRLDHDYTEGDYVALKGTLFSPDAFPSLARALTPRKKRAIGHQVLRPLLAPKIQAAPRLPADQVLIHFRSGDIFVPGRAAPSYRQPPLSYYQFCLDEAVRRGARRALVLYEDLRNPIIEPFLEYCAKEGVEHQAKSGLFEDDLADMMGAHTLISSRSTLMEGLTFVSSNLETVFLFEDAEHARIVQGSGLRCVHIRDIEGRFPRRGGWNNTEDQLELMRTYPRSALRPDEHP